MYSGMIVGFLLIISKVKKILLRLFLFRKCYIMGYKIILNIKFNDRIYSE